MQEVTKKRKFPYQIHIAIGLMWIIIGIFLQSGWQQILWIAFGIVFLAIGWFGRKR